MCHFLRQGSSIYPQTPATADTMENSTIKHLVFQMKNIQENGVDPLSLRRHSSTLRQRDLDTNRDLFSQKSKVTSLDSEAEPFSP